MNDANIARIANALERFVDQNDESTERVERRYRESIELRADDIARVQQQQADHARQHADNVRQGEASLRQTDEAMKAVELMRAAIGQLIVRIEAIEKR